MKTRILVFVVIALLSNVSYAYKECAVKTNKLYIGDNGYLWMTFVGGGVAHMASSDVDFERTYAMLLAAQMADKTVAVRFQDSNAVCNSGTRSDISGVWLYK